jgi:hypothetical protein
MWTALSQGLVREGKVKEEYGTYEEYVKGEAASPLLWEHAAREEGVHVKGSTGFRTPLKCPSDKYEVEKGFLNCAPGHVIIFLPKCENLCTNTHGAEKNELPCRCMATLEERQSSDECVAGQHYCNLHRYSYYPKCTTDRTACPVGELNKSDVPCTCVAKDAENKEKVWECLTFHTCDPNGNSRETACVNKPEPKPKQKQLREGKGKLQQAPEPKAAKHVQEKKQEEEQQQKEGQQEFDYVGPLPIWEMIDQEKHDYNDINIGTETIILPVRIPNDAEMNDKSPNTSNKKKRKQQT